MDGPDKDGFIGDIIFALEWLGVTKAVAGDRLATANMATNESVLLMVMVLIFGWIGAMEVEGCISTATRIESWIFIK